MCGIAGFIGSPSDASFFLNQAKNCMKHRGPDGEGEFIQSWSGLSHVRLALMGTNGAGSQPAVNQRYALSFNGEIFNWRELSKELRDLGISQFSNSDTETLLNAITYWGLDAAVPKLRGIFAFILVDKLQKNVSLVRDSAGTKPLYFLHKQKAIYFASEIKAFRMFGLELDREGLKEYLTFQNFLSEGTLFTGVKMVKQGSITKFDLNLGNPNIKIWDPGFFYSGKLLSKNQHLETIDELLITAIKRNLVADFPIGAFLSSGIDSSMLAMCIQKFDPNANFFTLGFNSSNISPLEINFDEREATANFAKYLNLNHSVAEISSGSMEKVFDQLCWAIEEPRVGQSYPNLFAAKLAKQTVKACISGAGGDELFGGYPWRYSATLDSQGQGKAFQILEYLKVWHRLGSISEISGLMRLSEKSHLENSTSLMASILEENSQHRNHYELSDLMYFEFKTFLHGLLTIDDKIAMSEGLEIRVPFLDQDIVHFAQNLNDNMRISNAGFIHKSVNENDLKSIPLASNQGKIILRELAKKQKNPLAELPKKGFSGPDASWFKNQSLDFVKTRLLSRNANIWDELDFEQGKSLIEGHLNGNSNRRLLIWSLLSLESVFRQFL